MKIGKLELANNIFLAPMAGVTDMPFRLICREFGCGMVYTEMVSAKGLYYGGERTEELLIIRDEEHPIGVQIFGSDPEIMAEIAKKLESSPADVIDINMGCPAPKITKNNEGCALMRDLSLSSRIIEAVARSSSKPVTVKCRKGWDEDNSNAVLFAKMAENSGACAITVHGRTKEQYYSGKADWDIIKEVKEAVCIPVIGNGDIFSGIDAKKMLDLTNCDGVMVARGAQGNPWIFQDILHYLKTGKEISPPSAVDRINLAIRHTEMMVEYKGEYCAVREMRKHISWYLKGIKNAAEIRDKINCSRSMQEIRSILADFLEECAKI